MAEFSELVQALTWLLTNRIQQKIQYTHGLLGDGNGRVRVSTIPGSPEVDYVFVRPDRFSNRTFKVFNKRIEGQDGDPIIIGELPWEPDLVQVVDMDWAAYADVGWGDDVTTTNRHGNSHQWRDGAPGIDTFNVYRRQFGDLKTYSTTSGTLDVGVSPYSLDLFGKQYQWPGIQDFSLAGALPATTGTARMALVYWSPASGTTQGFLGVATGTLGGDSEATILNRPASPQGVIPSAFVRLAGGQSSITEFDIWDAREPFRPGLSFSTGTAGLSADMIPISDTSGLYTGSTVEAALDEIGFDGARVSKVWKSDFGAVALEIDAAGNVTINSGTLTLPSDIIHLGDDTKISFTDDDIEFTVGNLSMLKLTKTAQDLIEIGDTAGGSDVDINFNNGQMFLEGDSGNFIIGASASPSAKLVVFDSGTLIPIIFLNDGDISTPFTTIGTPNNDANTIGRIGGASSADGGLVVSGFTDSTAGAAAIGLWFEGYLGAASPIAPAITINAYKTNGGTGGGAIAASEMALQITNAFSTKLATVLGNGDFGIQNISPTTPLLTGFSNAGLTIGDGSATAGVVLYSATNSTLSSLRFGDGGGGVYDQGFIVYDHNNDKLSLGANRGTALTIDSSQNIGINGITLPSAELDIGAGAIEGEEMTAPGAGASNTYRLYAEDNGAGKTRLMVIFATGAAQQIAIEP